VSVLSLLAAALAAVVPAPLAAARPTDSRAAAPPAPAYADLVDLALAAPVVAQVRTVEAIPVKDADAAGLRAGFARLYIEAEVTALVRAPGPIPARVRYLADLPRDSRGRPPKIAKGSAFLLFAAPVPGRPAELRLVARDAQLPFDARTAERLRAIVRETSAAAPPPVVTGIGRAFHSPGNLPGESETQIFVQTQDRRPVSLSILRRPGQAPRWSVALAEVVDDSAAAPRPETLLWYRLACGLPRSLPPRSLEDADAAAGAAIRRDYQLVIDSLGPCGRKRPAA
jgi:hypothetical protein